MLGTRRDSTDNKRVGGGDGCGWLRRAAGRGGGGAETGACRLKTNAYAFFAVPFPAINFPRLTYYTKGKNIFEVYYSLCVTRDPPLFGQGCEAGEEAKEGGTEGGWHPSREAASPLECGVGCPTAFFLSAWVFAAGSFSPKQRAPAKVSVRSSLSFHIRCV